MWFCIDNAISDCQISHMANISLATDYVGK